MSRNGYIRVPRAIADWPATHAGVAVHVLGRARYASGIAAVRGVMIEEGELISSAASIAAAAAVPRSTAVRVVAKLEDAGILAVVPDETIRARSPNYDRRRHGTVYRIAAAGQLQGQPAGQLSEQPNGQPPTAAEPDGRRAGAIAPGTTDLPGGQLDGQPTGQPTGQPVNGGQLVGQLTEQPTGPPTGQPTEAPNAAAVDSYVEQPAATEPPTEPPTGQRTGQPTEQHKEEREEREEGRRVKREGQPPKAQRYPHLTSRGIKPEFLRDHTERSALDRALMNLALDRQGEHEKADEVAKSLDGLDKILRGSDGATALSLWIDWQVERNRKHDRARTLVSMRFSLRNLARIHRQGGGNQAVLHLLERAAIGQWAGIGADYDYPGKHSPRANAASGRPSTHHANDGGAEF